ncbi:type II toxin-antitoxin system PemK/MazF family toxin [Candidatus Glomeribacter gigasporarum]|uniref:type II toxin-antitoxin system PemK/MazF family toxin n=1 Tax=Candidatus Glomeribacter gigasporarum TaxID=132144 RepID=UPI001EF0DAD7|nr:type II toxin-antitoxin system PemK/MazF family toxin [Candidatus Glomeribacter gigasporarum]
MGSLKRGDVVTIAGGKGDYGSKPRPAIIIQSDIFNELKSISVLPLTSHIEDAPVFRVVIEPDKSNGISKLSQAMVDKIMPVRKEKISGIIGKINRKLMIKIESAIAIFYGIA